MALHRAPSQVVVFVALVAAASLGGWRYGVARAGGVPGSRQGATVLSVLDGDTIEVLIDGGDGRRMIRILGIDTPETHHPRKPVQCYGPEASAYTASRLTGKDVTLEWDVERVDIYGRLLAHVIVEGERFGDDLLRLGYARLLVIAPNGAHGREMLEIELEARATGAGLWSACSQE